MVGAILAQTRLHGLTRSGNWGEKFLLLLLGNANVGLFERIVDGESHNVLPLDGNDKHESVIDLVYKAVRGACAIDGAPEEYLSE